MKSDSELSLSQQDNQAGTTQPNPNQTPNSASTKKPKSASTDTISTPKLTKTGKPRKNCASTKKSNIEALRRTYLDQAAPAVAVHHGKEAVFSTISRLSPTETLDRTLKFLRQNFKRHGVSIPARIALTINRDRTGKKAKHLHIVWFIDKQIPNQHQHLLSALSEFNTFLHREEGRPRNSIVTKSIDPAKGGVWQLVAGYLISGNVNDLDDKLHIDAETRAEIEARLESGEQLDVLSIGDALIKYGGSHTVLARSTVWQGAGLDPVTALERSVAEFLLLRKREIVAFRPYPGLVGALTKAFLAGERVKHRLRPDIYLQPVRAHTAAWTVTLAATGSPQPGRLIPVQAAGNEWNLPNPIYDRLASQPGAAQGWTLPFVDMPEPGASIPIIPTWSPAASIPLIA